MPEPFLDVRLSSVAGVTVSDLAWNPGAADFSSLLCTVMSDGAVGLWDVKDKLAIIASLPPTTKATCCEYYSVAIVKIS